MWMRLGAAAAVVLGLAVGPAQASLVSIDAWQVGDGALTRDTATNLDWIDLSRTAGWGPADFLSGDISFLQSLGFEVATAFQVRQFFADAGLVQTFDDSLFIGGESDANTPIVQSLMDIMGCSRNCDQPPLSGFGSLILDGGPDAGKVSTGYYTFDSTVVGVGSWGVGKTGTANPEDVNGTFGGSSLFLVREVPDTDGLIRSRFLFGRPNPLPEPGALALLGLGLVGLVAARRRAA